MKKFILMVFTLVLVACGGGSAPSALDRLAGLNEGIGPTIGDEIQANNIDMVDVADWVWKVLMTVQLASSDLIGQSGFTIPPNPQNLTINFHADNVPLNGVFQGTATGSVDASGEIIDQNNGHLAVDVLGSYTAFSNVLGIILELPSTSSMHLAQTVQQANIQQLLDFQATLSVSGALGAKVDLDYHRTTINDGVNPVQFILSGTATVISGGQQYDCVFQPSGSPKPVICQ